MSELNNTKHINLDISPIPKSHESTKSKKKRLVTTLESWQITSNDLLYEPQLSYITQLVTNQITSHHPCKLIMQHISQKLNGYKSQDVKKGLFDADRFVDKPYVLDLLSKSSNKCYYCNMNVLVLYENVREPKQWSLDRIFNDQGHNKENLVIACLDCNVSRKTMYHERYAFTKQLVIVKQH
jgi:hypothetical protein